MTRVARDSVLVTGLNTAAQVASFVLFAAIAKLFGASSRTDAFFLSLTIPMLFIGPVVNAIRAVFIPIVAECRAKHPAAQGRLVGSTVLYVLLLSVAGVALFALGAPVLLPLTAKGLPPEVRPLVVRMTLLLLPLVVAQTVSAVLSATYNAVGRFTLPALTAGARHVVALGVLVLAYRHGGIMVLPAAFVAGAAFQVLVLVAFWRTVGVPFTWTLRLGDEFRHSLRLAVPLVLGTVALYLAILVTRFFASWLPEGSVTILDYGSRITSATMEVLTSGVLLVTLANWSQLIQRGGNRVLRSQVRQTVVHVLFAVMPILAILVALRVPAVATLLGRGRFDPATVAATASILAILVLGLPLDIIGRIYVRLFLVKQMTWTLGMAALGRLALVTALSLAVIHPLGLPGLALTESVGIAAVTVYFVHAGRPLGCGWSLFSGLGQPLGRILILAIASAVVAGLVGHGLAGLPAAVVLVAGSIAGAATYVLLAMLAGTGELRSFVRLFSQRLQGSS
jgi:putative peptidoglycan lipid II flippase